MTVVAEEEFNPDDHSVSEVVEHLEQADKAERERVLDAEKGGANRATIRKWQPSGEGDAADEQAGSVDAGEEVHEFDSTEENAVHLLAAVRRLGLHPRVVTTFNGRLQAPESVVRAADISPAKD